MRRIRAQTAWERAEGDAASQPAEEAFDAVTELAGRLVREGDGHDARGRYTDLVDHVGDAVGDDACLTATGTSQNEQRPLGVSDGFVLGWVKPFEYGHGTLCRRGVDAAFREAAPGGGAGIVCELVYSFVL